MTMDVPSLLLRDFSDLTRPELVARAKHLEILLARVAYTHDNLSPRQLRAFVLAILTLILTCILTDTILFSGITGLITLIGVLRYSRLPMTWHAQLQEGLSRLECLRSSPLRHMICEPTTAPDWYDASSCLEAEIKLVHVAISQAASPFIA